MSNLLLPLTGAFVFIAAFVYVMAALHMFN
jgi:hypothetical protein